MRTLSKLNFLFKTLLMRTKRASRRCNLKTRRCLLITVSVYVLTFCVVLPFLCHDLPLTKYYALRRDSIDTITKAEELNRVHADNAEKRLTSLPKESTKRLYEQSMRQDNLRFVIAVQTIPRSGLEGPPPRYLTQVMVALHDVLEQAGRLGETAVFMCNTQRPSGEEHAEAIALSEYFPLVVHRSLGSDPNRYEREKQDYLFCLREAQQLSPDYVLVLEDDVLPHTDFYSVLDHVLKHKVESSIRQGELRSVQDEWSWMKLNLPTNLMKYEGNVFFALEWVAISLIGSIITVFIIEALYSGMHPDKSKSTVLLLFIVCFAYFMLSTWVLGRSYMNLPLTLSKTFYKLGPGTSCCTQAVLFPRKQLPDVMQHMQAITLDRFTPLDFALDEYRTQRNLRQFLISPNVASHIGVISSLHGHPNNRVAENYLFAVKNLRTLLPTWFVQD